MDLENIIKTAEAQTADRTNSGLDTFNQVVPVSTFGGGSGSALSNVLNQVFYLGLAIAVIAAVVMIIRGGVQYMTIDAAASKKSGARMVQAAIGGLVLAFAAVLILNTINPNITSLSLDFKPLQQTGGFGTTTVTSGSRVPGVPNTATGGTNNIAQFTNINNPDLARASASGVLAINGISYNFISGGGGNGYLPPGTYTVTDGRLRNDSTMSVDGFGYSFNLNDAYDPRVGATRTELRIHPDGGNPGTLGCIGIQGGADTQRQFYNDLSNAIRNNGGSYTITVR